jgi:hypothetical protein
MQILISGNAWITIPILIMGVVSLFLLVYSVVRFSRRKPITASMCDTILFLGLGSLAWAIIGQLTGLFVAADYIQKNPEVQASIIWAGFKVSLIGPIMGLGVLIFSGIGWFVLRLLRKQASGMTERTTL